MNHPPAAQKYLAVFLTGLFCILAPDPVRAEPSAWDTNYGRLTMHRAADGVVKGNYKDSAIQGREMAGDRVSGVWYSKQGKVKCATRKFNTSHWGTFSFNFPTDNVLVGTWSYCARKTRGGAWSGTRVPTNVKDRLLGRWVGDADAYMAANKQPGHSPQDVEQVAMRFSSARWTLQAGGEIEAYPFFLAKDAIFDGDACRGEPFDRANFDRVYRDDNGVVIVSIEDGDMFCRTIEKLSDDKLILSYVGAKLNFHYYKRDVDRP